MNKTLKDSGVEWIGEVPQHWKIERIGNLFKLRNDKVSDLDFEPLSVTKKGIVKQLETAAKSNDHSNRKKVCVNDFVINSRSDRKLSSGISPYNGSVSLINIVLYCNTLEPSFINYLLKNYGFAEEFYRWGTGIVADLWSTNYGRMKKILVAFPPDIEEQKKIADFLDEKVAKIDSLTEKTNISIKELKTYLQSLMFEAITKGLNPKVKMKDTEIEWIGSIPSHWKLSKLKNIFEIKKVIANSLGYDVLSVTQQGLKIKDIESNEGQLSSDYSKYQIVERNDFVMNHMDLLTGWVDCSKYIGVTSPDYRVFRFKGNNEQNSNYYKFLLQACYLNKIFYGYGQGVSNHGRWRLPTDEFLNFYIPIPSLNEQIEIANYLNEKVLKINKLISQKEKLIEGLENYKTSLIYEYVTGKKEVM